MKRGSILCVAVIICVLLTLCLSAPAALQAPSKEVPDAVINGRSQEQQNEDENVAALHSLATVNQTLSSASAAANNTAAMAAAKNGKADGLETADQPISQEKRSSDMFSELAASKDTPRDMAEYIFWTGDENGVAKTISDFVYQGLMTQDEGVTFLEEVKYFLQELQVKYGTVSAVAGLGDAEQGNDPPKPTKTSPNLVEKIPIGNQLVGEIPKSASTLSAVSKVAADSNTTEMKERLQLAELLSNEYSLEEIIYQLSRILFTQSLSQEGSAEAEEALQRFADFLEKDSKEGRLSPQLQKKVLDVLLMALFDALGDQSRSTASHAKQMNLSFMKKPSLLKNP